MLCSLCFATKSKASVVFTFYRRGQGTVGLFPTTCELPGGTLENDSDLLQELSGPLGWWPYSLHP